MYTTMPAVAGSLWSAMPLRKWFKGFLLVTLLTCLLVVLGWLLDINLLKGPVTHQVMMNPVIAVSLSLLALIYWLMALYHRPPAILLLTAYLLIVTVLFIASWKLLNTTGAVSFDVDGLLFPSQIAQHKQQGKLCVITPVTAICMVLVSGAFALLQVRTRSGRSPAQYPAMVVLALVYFSLLSHLYQVEAFYGLFDYIPMPLYSAIAFGLLSLSVLAATAGSGLMDIFSGTHAGTALARFVAPAVILVPALFGWLRLYGHWTGIFTTEFGVTILVSSITLFFLALTWYAAKLLNTRDTEKEIAHQALEQVKGETQYQALLLQNISDVIISTDVDFRIVSWNKAAEEMYGWTQQEVLNKPITDVVKPVYEKESREDILSAYFKNNYWKGEVIHHTRLGERLSVLVTTTVLQQEGAKTGTVAVIRDITQRKRAEQNFRDLLNAAPDATVIVNAKGIIQMVNKRVEELFLFQREELVNQPVEMLMPLALKENHVRHMQQYVREPRVRPMGAGMELQARRRDGSLFPVEISLSPLETEAGLLVSASIRDITERRAIEQRLMMFNEELEQQVQARTTEILQINDQLRLLSSRLEEVREQERIRIAREIHDELGQQLTGLKMDISWLSKKTGHMDEHLQQKFTGVLGLLDEMVQTVRRISTELRPAVLDDLGLLAAIEWHSAEFEKRFHINLQLSLPGDDLVVPVEKATGIFRVYQEALTNIARHAGATQVWTTVSVKEDRFILLVEDNGRGFDAREVKARKTLGLAGMKERVNMMAGRYSITSTTDRGTVVSIEVPLQY